MGKRNVSISTPFNRVDFLHLKYDIEVFLRERYERRIIEPLPYFLYEIRGSQCDIATPRHVEIEDANVAPMILLSAKAARILLADSSAVPAPVVAVDA